RATQLFRLAFACIRVNIVAKFGGGDHAAFLNAQRGDTRRRFRSEPGDGPSGACRAGGRRGSGDPGLGLSPRTPAPLRPRVGPQRLALSSRLELPSDRGRSTPPARSRGLPPRRAAPLCARIWAAPHAPPC